MKESKRGDGPISETFTLPPRRQDPVQIRSVKVEGHDNLSQQGSKRPNPDRLAPTSLPTLEASPEPREVARATRLCENRAKMAAMGASRPSFSSNLSSRRAPFGQQLADTTAQGSRGFLSTLWLVRRPPAAPIR